MRNASARKRDVERTRSARPGHPFYVEFLDTEPEVVGVEASRCLNVSHAKIHPYACGARAVLLLAPGMYFVPLNAAARSRARTLMVAVLPDPQREFANLG